ncbi:3-oxo-tetronate kinase [Sphaerochaeta sp.]|uniref:3-oxo-tetronate kinase n=1 Tax=Sphaerochaeta sp. TaxID=1972642 RepID=UPI002FC781C2
MTTIIMNMGRIVPVTIMETTKNKRGRSAVRLGVIADDFTGASDIAGFLADGGMRTIMYNGFPANLPKDEADALVVGLKIRSCTAKEAVDEALRALQFLQDVGCDRFYYKYCSTFDSTHEGNIGPVVDALLQALSLSFTIICPALPVNGRTVCHGYLYVDHDLLCESSMATHPLTPMTDAKLSRLMEGQFSGKIGHVYYPAVFSGPTAVRARLAALQEEGVTYAVMDVLRDEDLSVIAEATTDMKLLSGGSGLAIGLTAFLSSKGGLKPAEGASFVPRRQKGVVIAGSCSQRTNEQVASYRKCAPSRFIDEASCLHDVQYAQVLADWVLSHLDGEYFPLLYATKTPQQLKNSKATFGEESVAQAIEKVIGTVASLLHAEGIGTFLIAGGETSGAVAAALGVYGYTIGSQIDPGVSWLQALDDDTLQFAYKSGNFGSVDFFVKAQHMCR